MNKTVIAMSGGVDSSVAAQIISQNNTECIGATMRLIDGSGKFFTRDAQCSGEQAVNDAKAVADKLGIQYYVFPFINDFEEYVIKNFVKTYETGATPNPCVECNRNLKFKALFEKAKELGCDTIATGHYAITEKMNGRYCLKKAKDKNKDQSYVLWGLSQQELASACFPLGNMDKQEVRRIAGEYGFDNADKKESQDICFIPDGDYAAFIERYTNKKYPHGNFVDKHNKILGEHKGIIRYTIGQRRGLGLALPEPMYVCKKDIESNTVILCKNEELFSSDVIIDKVNWVSMEKTHKPFKALARIRYNMSETPCVVTPIDNKRLLLTFDAPQRAVTPGQSAVIYTDDYVLCGGIITQQ